MKVHNIRFGFACNSSSSHSLIFLPPERIETLGGDYIVGSYADAREARIDLKEDEAGEDTFSITPGSYDFGWDTFTAVSAETKRMYVGITLYDNLRRVCSPEIARIVASQWCGRELESQADRFDTPNGYIDHQSMAILPRSWDEKGLDVEFAQRYVQHMMRSDLVILGGNDNSTDDSNSHPMESDPDAKSAELNIPYDGDNEGMVCRYDQQFDYWTIYDRGTGHKTRVSFDKMGDFKVERASAPELVDFKITDYCPYNCAFCYQGSTVAGKHVKSDEMYRWVSLLKDMRVFEVAIGGGEPTLHPEFINILRLFRSNGIVPNFTTKNMAWLRDPKKWVPVMEQCGAFAYSVDSEDEVVELATLLELNGIKTMDPNGARVVTLQYVMGSTNEYKFEKILEAAKKHNLRITLLGYKTTGRGAHFKPQPYTSWVKIVRKVYGKGYVAVNIDTALASEFEKELKKKGVPSWLFHTTEGSFSMYVDAVEHRIAPSSYCKPEEFIAFTADYSKDLPRKFRDYFMSFHGWTPPVQHSKMEMLLEE
jgi:MoaA/NifB/PqqE/SkfB family radical SAM enzyme